MNAREKGPEGNMITVFLSQLKRSASAPPTEASERMPHFGFRRALADNWLTSALPLSSARFQNEFIRCCGPRGCVQVIYFSYLFIYFLTPRAYISQKNQYRILGLGFFFSFFSLFFGIHASPAAQVSQTSRLSLTRRR